nr:MAG TPA: hypothetical protein [Caudoviricetes sp.]
MVMRFGPFEKMGHFIFEKSLKSSKKVCTF